jgi:rhodanese-related sulfurtransferase
MSALPYAGDVSPLEAWDILKEDSSAVVVDTRTDAEFAYVGGPDLGTLRNPMFRISWKIFPDMDQNPDFEAAVKTAVPDVTAKILFLCRSGVRSAAAAKKMTEQGYVACYNILEGFEGDKDGDAHRGTVNGWKVRGLPWKQE